MSLPGTRKGQITQPPAIAQANGACGALPSAHSAHGQVFVEARWQPLPCAAVGPPLAYSGAPIGGQQGGVRGWTEAGRQLEGAHGDCIPQGMLLRRPYDPMPGQALPVQPAPSSCTKALDSRGTALLSEADKAAGVHSPVPVKDAEATNSGTDFKLADRQYFGEDDNHLAGRNLPS
jgi:hypothetical protein